VRYLVVNTSIWSFDHEVLLAGRWIKSVRSRDNVVIVALACQAVKAWPAYGRDRIVEVEHQVALFTNWKNGPSE
jgi:hypothetical protein